MLAGPAQPSTASSAAQPTTRAQPEGHTPGSPSGRAGSTAGRQQPPPPYPLLIRPALPYGSAPAVLPTLPALSQPCCPSGCAAAVLPARLRQNQPWMGHCHARAAQRSTATVEPGHPRCRVSCGKCWGHCCGQAVCCSTTRPRSDQGSSHVVRGKSARRATTDGRPSSCRWASSRGAPGERARRPSSRW